MNFSAMDKMLAGTYTLPLVSFFDTIAEILLKYLFLFSLCCFSLLFVLMQPLAAQTNTTESLELRLATIEQQYDRQVSSILSNYFEPDKFFVDIEIDGQFVNDIYRSTENRIIRDPNDEVIMPGLPFLPEENRQQEEVYNETRQTIINEQTVQRLQIQQVRINVYADSSFTQQKVEFIELIAGIAGKINEQRGDLVNVSLISMPDFGIDRFSPPPVSTETEPETVFGSIDDYIPGFILVLLIGLTLLIGRFTNKPAKSTTSLRRQRMQLISDQQSNSEKSNSPASNVNVNRPQKSFSTSDQPDFSIITDQFLNNSKDVALLFELWMDKDQESGALKCAKVVNVIDKHLLKSLKGDLETENYEIIAEKVESMEPLDFKEKKEITNTFISEIQEGTNTHSESNKHQQLGLFQFLEHLNNSQIVRLLSDEDQTTSALIIDYLPQHKETEIIDRLNENRTTEIMLGMTDLNNLSYKEHKEISSRLFSKAMDILETDKKKEQSSKNVLRVIENLPLNEQSKYIEQLKATGSPVGEIIEKKFITIDDISNIEYNVLKNAIDHLPTETVLSACIGLDDETIEKILSTRPKREQRLLRIEIKQTDFFETEEIHEAKARLMSAIRKSVDKSKHI